MSKRLELSNVTKWAMDLMFLQADMLEMSLVRAIELAEKDGIKVQDLDYEVRRLVKAATQTLRKLNRSTRQIPEEDQMQFGEESDQMLQFLWLLLDRCGDDRGKMKELYREIRDNHDSGLGINMDRAEREAYGEF